MICLILSFNTFGHRSVLVLSQAGEGTATLSPLDLGTATSYLDGREPAVVKQSWSLFSKSKLVFSQVGFSRVMHVYVILWV